MTTAILLSGIPGSGKTTWAKKHVTERIAKGEHWQHICRDDLRSALHFTLWKPRLEDAVTDARDALIRASLKRGDSIVVDETFTNPKHRDRMFALITAEFPDVEVMTKEFDVPMQECIKRDMKRGEKAVGPGVIRKHARARAETPPPGNFDAILCDIDGTLAILAEGYSPYDPQHYPHDTPNTPVARVVSAARHHAQCELILVSGRDAAHRDVTIAWIEDNLPYLNPSGLLMRPTGDRRPDYVIKRELYEQSIKGRYTVLAVFDDRDQTVDEWRQLGLPTFQVADGGF